MELYYPGYPYVTPDGDASQSEVDTLEDRVSDIENNGVPTSLAGVVYTNGVLVAPNNSSVQIAGNTLTNAFGVITYGKLLG